ncbi:glycosyltransferase [Microbacterium sp.]|uniref:glycosyltransferase n=1 Tax=Microbacterium sp. TaxID=51671 RepID=UPI003C78134B
MSSILICINPHPSHIAPMLDVVHAFVGAGHRVRVLTGIRFGDVIRAVGAEPLALPPAADVLEGLDSRERPRGRRAMNDGVRETFIDPARAQLPVLTAALAAEHTDALVIDPIFLSAYLLGADRPVLAACSFFPLSVSSVDTAPFGLGMAPPRTAADRVQSRAIAWFARRVLLAPVHREFDAFYREHGLPPLGDLFFTDYFFRPGFIDLYAQFTVPSFEYPRSDLPECVRYYGRLRPPNGTAELPPWWDEVDDTRPIIHVSQGTVGTADFTELVVPTLEALADDDVTVVVSAGRTGAATVGELPPLPRNAFAADFLPYDELFPRLSAFVTNGGYGGLHYALAHGVPIVVAGDTEDKVETSARVAWSGAGISLRTGRPSADAVRKAVREVLREPRYRAASARIGRDLAAAPGAAGLVADVERLIGARVGSVR